MPNRRIPIRKFQKFVFSAGWMEIYYEPDYNLTRYITPSGNTVDTTRTGDEVEVDPFAIPYPRNS